MKKQTSAFNAKTGFIGLSKVKEVLFSKPVRYVTLAVFYVLVGSATMCLEKPVNMQRVFNFHVKYLYLPFVVVAAVTLFTEKTKYIDRKMDIQMEMTYKVPKGSKGW